MFRYDWKTYIDAAMEFIVQSIATIGFIVTNSDKCLDTIGSDINQYNMS